MRLQGLTLPPSFVQTKDKWGFQMTARYEMYAGEGMDGSETCRMCCGPTCVSFLHVDGIREGPTSHAAFVCISRIKLGHIACSILPDPYVILICLPTQNSSSATLHRISSRRSSRTRPCEQTALLVLVEYM